MSNMSSVLSDMDWDEGLTIPVANAPNKALEDEVQRKQRETVTLHNELATNDDRVHAMSEHLRNIRQELQHTQSLVNARKNEIETEEHMSKIATREEGRLKHEILRVEKEIDELKEKKNVFENNIFKQTQKLEELKSRMNWDQQALEAWLEESARKDEDSMTLIKYTRQDDAKIKELSLRIEHMTEESQKKKKHLDHETMETLTAQIELDKTAEEFRKAHLERQELINQWELTIDQMQRRDKEIDLLAQQLVQVKMKAAEKEVEITEKQRFYEDQLENNQDFEKKIGLAERMAGKIRLDYQETEQQRDQFQSELDALKRTVDRTAIDLENTRGTVKHLKGDMVDKQKRLEQAKQVHEELIDKLKMSTETSLSAEERAARMDELMVEEERKQKEIDQELKRLRELQFKRAQELNESRSSERNTDAEIQGSRAAVRNLSSKISKLDHDSLKQQEIIYTQDFEIQKLERRINRMQGEQSNEEKLTLESKCRELTEELESKTQTHNLINLQLKRLQDDVRRVKRDLEGNTGQRSDLTSKIEELNLHNDTSQQELRRLTNQKQNLMVDENILKLELRRLRETLNTRSDSVLSLEKRRLQLETAMKERQQEINIHMEMLQSQVRSADTEKTQISGELHERISKIDKLRKRYEILMVSMAPPEGEEDKSQAYYVIKAAQDKEELQREGDELDAKIRKAEKEIRALENTIRLMNNRNETYRKSFNKVTDTSDEMDEKQQLDEQLRAVMDKYKYKRRQIRELQEDLQTMGNTLETLDRDESAYVEMMEEKQSKVLQLGKELDDQKAKIDRVAKQNAKYSRELRSAKKVKTETDEERDFEVKELRDLNKTALKHIGDAVHQHPEIAQAVHLYFSQSNLPMPSGPGSGLSSRTSSLPGSARSSMSGSGTSIKSGSSKHSAVQSMGRPTPVDIGAQIRTQDYAPGSGRSSASSGSSARGQTSGRR